MEITIGGWSAEFAHEALKLEEGRSAVVLSLFWVGMMTARMVLTPLLRRMPSGFVLGPFMAIAGLGSILLLSCQGETRAMVGLFLIGFGLAAGFPVVLGAIGEIYSELTGTAFSVAFVVALLGGSALPYLTGLLADRFGLRASLLTVPVALCMMGISLPSRPARACLAPASSRSGRTTLVLALEWLKQARGVMDRIEATQTENIRAAAELMAASIAAGRWVHTFGCGHATIPVEEMYPRIGGFVGFHPMIELPLSFFTHIVGEMGVRQFVFLEGVEGYGQRIMDSYSFDPRDTMWIFSHTGINSVNIDVALRARELGMKVVACGSAARGRDANPPPFLRQDPLRGGRCRRRQLRPLTDASVPIRNHQDKIAPVSTMAFVTLVWMIIATVAEILVEQGVTLHIHPSHNLPGDTTAHERLDAALREYKRRIAGV